LNSQAQEAFRNPNRYDQKRTSQSYVIVKMGRTQNSKEYGNTQERNTTKAN
jgi:hypothetical protein